ncbi:hypothetical protein GOEFS_041_00420 [Gordonia effusa NBRC 100432]|uniref:Uncharacterized protein n=1 Tax=Gordonia effusa NBRC 100432 TaxID=1077974 RepID=H0QYI7_9ACTN|nr:hypothetical protein GOEFS_041_00420 [Gordonia effusa NBRC 100432]
MKIHEEVAVYFALTFVGLCAIAYLLWRAFGPVANDDHSSRSADSRRTPPPIGPDDDPQFLFELDRREKRGDDSA